MRPPPPPPIQPPTWEPGRPPKLKKIKQLEKKKHNLENQIRRNPNNRKAINQLEGILKQLGSSPQPKHKAQPKTMNELTPRKIMVRTGRDPIPLRKPKASKPKEPKKPKDEIKKAIEHKKKDMGKIRKKIRDQGGDRRLEAKLEERSRETEGLKGLTEPRPDTRTNPIENQTHVRTYQVTGSLNHDVSNLILDTICPIIQTRTRVIYNFFCSIYQGKESNRSVSQDIVSQ